MSSGTKRPAPWCSFEPCVLSRQAWVSLSAIQEYVPFRDRVTARSREAASREHRTHSRQSSHICDIEELQTVRLMAGSQRNSPRVRTDVNRSEQRLRITESSRPVHLPASQTTGNHHNWP